MCNRDSQDYPLEPAKVVLSSNALNLVSWNTGDRLGRTPRLTLFCLTSWPPCLGQDDTFAKHHCQPEEKSQTTINDTSSPIPDRPKENQASPIPLLGSSLLITFLKNQGVVEKIANLFYQAKLRTPGFPDERACQWIIWIQEQLAENQLSRSF